MTMFRILCVTAGLTVAASACNRSDNHPATSAAKTPPTTTAETSQTVIVPPPAAAPGQTAGSSPSGTPGPMAESSAAATSTPAGTPGPMADSSASSTSTPAGTPGSSAAAPAPGSLAATPGSAASSPPAGTPGPTAAATPGTETPGSASQPAGAAGPVAGSDRFFISEAVNNALAEIDAGRLVAAKTSDPTIKSFAQQLERDHSSTSDELKRIASQKGIGLPTTVAGEPRSQLSKLSSLTGSGELERNFVQEFGINAHQQAINLFEREAREGQDPELKAFAERTLPRLREHLGMAQQLQTGRTAAPGGGR